MQENVLKTNMLKKAREIHDNLHLQSVWIQSLGTKEI